MIIYIIKVWINIFGYIEKIITLDKIKITVKNKMHFILDVWANALNPQLHQ